MTSKIVQVEQGLLRGKECVDYQNGIYYSFYGIPYAKPPLGELRFKSPKPPDCWTGILDATEEKEGCISRHPFSSKIVGGEDCLFLNVYTRQLPSPKCDKLKPVMVWIHGGAFSVGSTKTELYGPDFLITEDIVLVTVSFRLGILGFLCMEDPSVGVPGNAALRDIIMALKWVQRNIKQFGGDPNNVTVFGESSGAISIHYIMLSPLGKGLFHKVILQSATTLNHWAVGTRYITKELAEILGTNYATDADILKHLQSIPLEQLFKIREKFKTKISAHIPRNFFPVIEKAASLEPPVICEDPLQLIIRGDYAKVPMIIGYTSEEGLFFEPMLKRTDENALLIRNLEDLVPHHLNLQRGSDLSMKTGLRIKEFYFGNRDITPANKAMYYKMASDNFFMYAVQATAKYHMKNSGHPVYLYKFSVDERFNFYKKLNNCTHPGACHCDDVCYLFKLSQTPEIIPESIEDKTLRRMVKLWTNFARCGDPNSNDKDSLVDVVWKPVERNTTHFLDIGTDLVPGINPDAERFAFWEDIYSLHPVVARL